MTEALAKAPGSAEQVRLADKMLRRDCSWLPGAFRAARAAGVLPGLPCREDGQGGGLASPDPTGGSVTPQGNAAGEDEFRGDDKVRKAEGSSCKGGEKKRRGDCYPQSRA